MLTFTSLNKKQAKEINLFIKKVFNEFVGSAYSNRGNEEFYKYVESEALRKRIGDKHLLILNKNRGNINGILELRNYNHVSMLFVDGNHQRKGIGRSLLNEAIRIAKEKAPKIISFTVRSSPNAIEAYKKFGFRKSGDEKTENGIRYIEMKKDIILTE